MRNQSKPITVHVLLLLIFCHIPAKPDSTSPMVESERNALFSVIQGFVGTWWNGSVLYPDPCGWTPIEGVQCDLFGDFWYITVLSIGPIQENSLECKQKPEFRSELFELKHLRSISFYSCFVSTSHPFSIPTENWEKLAGTLESIDFRRNPGLVGEIPASLGCLMKLQSLVLLENGLTGSLPTSLGNLIRLKRLVLAGNQFSGQIPSSLGGLNELLILDLSMNNLSGFLPSELGDLVSLLKLDLSMNYLAGKLPENLSRLKNLTLLDLKNNRFSGGLPESFAEMISLEEMILGGNPIGGKLNLDWANLQSLQILDLSDSGFTGTIPESVPELKKLRFLALDSNQLSGQVSLKLADLPCINTMHLNGNNLTGILQFPLRFYQKMGWRFAIWNNPNLCYPLGLPAIDSLAGLKPCQQQGSAISSSKSKQGCSEIGSDSKPNSNFISFYSGSTGLGRYWILIWMCSWSLVVNLSF